MRWHDPHTSHNIKRALLSLVSSFAFLALCTTLAYRFLTNHYIRYGSPSPSPSPSSSPQPLPNHWIDTFATAPQWANTKDRLPPPFNDTVIPLQNVTIRQTVQITIGADLLRFRFSNAFGLADLPITRVTIANPLPCCGETEVLLGSKSLDAQTLQTLTFGGDESISVPKGGLVISDPVNFPTNHRATISINIYTEEGQRSEIVTAHLNSRVTTHFIQGDHTQTPDLDETAAVRTPQWFIISGVEAYKPGSSGSFVVFGDSLTDGAKSRMNRGRKWPDLLFRRLQESEGTDLGDISIINAGIVGNQVLDDGKGQNAVARFDRDVLSHSGMRYALIYIGINDLGHSNSSSPLAQTLVTSRLITFYQQLIIRLHTLNIPVFGGTLSPFVCSEGHVGGNLLSHGIERETTRQSVNKWIRTSGYFDAVVDFDEMLRSEGNETILTERFDSGDCLHFNDIGAAEVARRFPVELLREFKGGVRKML